MKAVIIIPARINSQRLEKKPLVKIFDKPLIWWVCKACKETGIETILATDSEEVKNAVKDLNIQVFITPSELPSGSDRVAYVAKNLDAEKIINHQGDEPFAYIEDVNALLSALNHYPVATLALKDDCKEDSCVKVVVNSKSEAIYFSRANIPFQRNKNPNYPLKHVGIYAYQKEALLEFCQHSPSEIELTEGLEQLRFFEIGFKVKVIKTNNFYHGVDTKEDLEKVANKLRLLRSSMFNL
ncbi:MAG: 3-deoxy-manno-octulosonate cytidylyltransferase [Aquificaceae bacterium]|nr:3-deoxy-manno-octulosonate cytidylyltransferase [Aquificaceae bacterium]MDW8237028.1 3-deoxy-manno-octulosonate cytidylyltransferase [Aquificaceae bacterium]